MGIGMKTARNVTKMLDTMESDPAQHQRLRPLLEILGRLVDPGPAQASDLTSSKLDQITGHGGQACWETYRHNEPSFIRWSVRWYFDGEIIVVFDAVN